MSNLGLTVESQVAKGSATNSSPKFDTNKRPSGEVFNYLTDASIFPSINDLPTQLLENFTNECNIENKDLNKSYSDIILNVLNSRNKHTYRGEYDQYKSGTDYEKLYDIIINMITQSESAQKENKSTISMEFINTLSDELSFLLLIEFMFIDTITHKNNENNVLNFIKNYLKTGICPTNNYNYDDYIKILTSLDTKYFNHFFVVNLIDYADIDFDLIKDDYRTKIELGNDGQTGIDYLIQQLQNIINHNQSPPPILSTTIGNKRHHNEVSTNDSMDLDTNLNTPTTNQPPKSKRLKISNQAIIDNGKSQIQQIIDNSIKSAESLMIDHNNNNETALNNISSISATTIGPNIDIDPNTTFVPETQLSDSCNIINNNPTKSISEVTDTDLTPDEQVINDRKLLSEGKKLYVLFVANGSWDEIKEYADITDFNDIDKINHEKIEIDNDDDTINQSLVQKSDLIKDPRWKGHSQYCNIQFECPYHNKHHKHNQHDNPLSNIDINVNNVNHNNNNNNNNVNNNINKFNSLIINNTVSKFDINNNKKSFYHQLNLKGKLDKIKQFKDEDEICMDFYIFNEEIPNEFKFLKPLSKNINININAGIKDNMVVNNMNDLIHHEANLKNGLNRCKIKDPIDKNKLTRRLLDQTLLNYNDLKIMSCLTCPERTDDPNLQRFTVYDEGSNQSINYYDINDYPNMNLVIQCAHRHNIDLKKCPSIEIEINGDDDLNKALAYNKFGILCTDIGGIWNEIDVGDIVSYKIFKPTLEHRKDIINRQRKSYLQFAKNTNNNDNKENENSFRKLAYRTALNTNDRITYTINNEFSSEFKRFAKIDDKQEYFITNKRIDFYDHPKHNKKIIFYINKNGPLYQKYNSNLISYLQRDLSRFKNNNNDKDILSLDPFISFSHNNHYNIIINEGSNDIELQMRLPQNNYNDEGDQFKLYELIQSHFMTYNLFVNKKNNLMDKKGGNKEYLKPIHVEIKHVWRHKQPNFEKRKKEMLSGGNKSLKPLFKDKVSIIIANCDINSIPDIIGIGGQKIKITKIGNEKDEIDEAIDNFCKQCTTCLGYTCPRDECVHYARIDEERKKQQDRSNDNRYKNRRRVGRGCHNCGLIGGHWASDNWKCTEKRYCKHCGSHDHNSLASNRCPVATGIAIRCLMYKKAFILNTRSSNKIYRENHDIKALSELWNPVHIKVTPSNYNINTWKTKQTQCDQIYQQAIRNWKLQKLKCQKLLHNNKINYIDNLDQEVSNCDTSYNPKEWKRNNNQILFERLRQEQLQMIKKINDIKNIRKNRNKFLKERIIKIGIDKVKQSKEIRDKYINRYNRLSESDESSGSINLNDIYNDNNLNVREISNNMTIDIEESDYESNNMNDDEFNLNKRNDVTITTKNKNRNKKRNKYKKVQSKHNPNNKLNKNSNSKVNNNSNNNSNNKNDNNSNNKNNNNPNSKNDNNSNNNSNNKNNNNPNNKNDNNSNNKINNNPNNKSNNKNNNKINNNINNNKSNKDQKHQKTISPIRTWEAINNNNNPTSLKTKIQQNKKSEFERTGLNISINPIKIPTVLINTNQPNNQTQSNNQIQSQIPTILINTNQSNPHSRDTSHENDINNSSKISDELHDSANLEKLAPGLTGQPPGNMPSAANNYISSHNHNSTDIYYNNDNKPIVNTFIKAGKLKLNQ